MAQGNWIHNMTGIEQVRRTSDIPKNSEAESQQRNTAPTVQLSNATVERNTDIGDYTYFVGYAHVYTNTTIGRYCSIGAGAIIAGAHHPLNAFSTSPIACHSFIEETKQHPRTIIGNDVWIGSNSTIKGGVNIGTGAVIGAGAVVTKDIPPYAVVAGVPAKIIKYRFDEATRDRLLLSEWWKLKPEQLKQFDAYHIDDFLTYFEDKKI